MDVHWAVTKLPFSCFQDPSTHPLKAIAGTARHPQLEGFWIKNREEPSPAYGFGGQIYEDFMVFDPCLWPCWPFGMAVLRTGTALDRAERHTRARWP
jgi:hypothetical protein